jgi:hypothetical protein
MKKIEGDWKSLKEAPPADCEANAAGRHPAREAGDTYERPLTAESALFTTPHQPSDQLGYDRLAGGGNERRSRE